MLGHVVASLATRVPLLLVAGERDNPSKDAVQSVRQLVERSRLNKVELFPSSLHGYKLLRLEPKVTASLFHFLEISLKNRPVEWEPQYNLTPVTFGDAQMVQNAKRPDTPKAKAKNNAVPAAQNQKAEDAKKLDGEKVAPDQPQKDSASPSPQPEQTRTEPTDSTRPDRLAQRTVPRARSNRSHGVSIPDRARFTLPRTSVRTRISENPSSGTGICNRTLEIAAASPEQSDCLASSPFACRFLPFPLPKPQLPCRIQEVCTTNVRDCDGLCLLAVFRLELI